MKYIFFTLFFFAFIFSACKEESIGQQPMDSIPPGPVSNPVLKRAVPGGVILTYTVPNDEDLLYIKAVYSRKDSILSETIVSLYTDTLMILGFGDTRPREVKLYAVDRSKNESTPVSITVTPLEPDVISIASSIDLISDFGGIHAYWDNPNRAEISVVLGQKDNNNEYTPIQTFYSSMVAGDGAVRGMDTIPGEFSVFVQDRWENQSEIKYYSLTPLYEVRFDRLKFSAVDLPGDAGSVGGWPKSNMWNGENGDNGYSSPGGTGTWPHTVTINLGVEGRLSRIRIQQRLGNYIFAEGNPRNFEIWGCSANEFDGSTGSFDKWTKFGDFESIKPSGQPMGTNTDEDIARATDGEDFIMPPTITKKVQYIRIKVTRTWAGGDNFQISELQVYGDNR